MKDTKEIKEYTPQQIADMERFAQLISRVPEGKRDAVIQTTEAVILGMEMAAWLNTAASRPSA